MRHGKIIPESPFRGDLALDRAQDARKSKFFLDNKGSITIIEFIELELEKFFC